MANEQIDDLSRAMFSSFSHDLKTPLAAIIGSLEVYTMMSDKLSNEKKLQLVEAALKESRRLDGFISNILEISKLEMGLITPKFSKVLLADVINSALITIKNKYPQANINVISVHEDIEVETDFHLLKKIINVFIENAIIHSETDQSIDVDYGMDKCKKYICVRDYGIGISESDFETIFTKYARIKLKDRKNAGTGLGLSIARAISQLLNCKINVSNHKNGGAIFCVSF